jgi:DNA adenine methylase
MIFNMFTPSLQPAQQSLFVGEFPLGPKIVNVASVSQRSPFRYPGGKTWLVPEVRDWLLHKTVKPTEFIEIFAGGGIVGLTVAAECLAEHVTLVELDPDVASVWRTLLSDDAEWLAQRIVQFPISVASAQELLSVTPETTRDRAFLTILKNRVNHGGILAPGTGLIKNGENGKGISSRWYPETLARRIRGIYAMRDRITFIEGDGLEVMRQNAARTDAVYFIDPPYTAPGKRAGKRLYAFNEIDHEGLFDLASTVSGDFMMTYDNAESVRQMADQRNLSIHEVPMKNTHHAKMTELLIGPAQHIL